MTRIAVVRTVYLPISETFIYGELRSMKRYEPYVFCEEQRNRSLFSYPRVAVDPQYKQLEHMISSGQLQLIHARFGTAGIRMLPIKEKWRVPLVTSFHGCDAPETKRMKKYKTSLKRLFAIGDCFTVPSNDLKKELIRHGCPEEKIVVQYSGIDLAKFAFKERTYPEKGPLHLLYVGRLVEKKGAGQLIRAFRLIRSACPQARLTIVGDGVLKRKLQRLTKELRLEKHIEFTGALPHHEVAKQLERSHLFCLPSLKDRTGNKEGIPNAIKEAMACGLPVVSTRHGGIPELITDGWNGMLIEEKDVKGLASQFIKLIQNPRLWPQLGHNARSTIEARFNQPVQTAKLEQLFDLVIKTHQRLESKKPFFSVVIPVYNREKYIGKAIESVLEQTCGDHEIIVVDDGSTDHTAKIAQSYGPKVRYIYQNNQGPSEARNTGIQAARGEFIAFLDSDDRFLPHKLQKNKEYLDSHPECDFLYSWYYDARVGRKMKLIRNIRQFKELDKFRLHLYKRTFMIRTSTAVIRRSCFETTGLFNPEFRYSQDWDMWLRLASRYPGHCQKEPLAIYRRHSRRPLPWRQRHQQIRRTALKLYHWNYATVSKLNRKYKVR